MEGVCLLCLHNPSTSIVIDENQQIKHEVIKLKTILPHVYLPLLFPNVPFRQANITLQLD